ISGGIPGAALLHGTIHSGVAVNASPAIYPLGGEQLGGVMAHEIGHFLGLYHSTERAMVLYGDDPLADTMTDDKTNLMYYVALSSARTLSKGQGFVMLRSALVR